MKTITLYWSNRPSKTAISVDSFLNGGNSLKESIYIGLWKDSNAQIQIRDAKTLERLIVGNYESVCKYIESLVIESNTFSRGHDDKYFLDPEPPIGF